MNCVRCKSCASKRRVGPNGPRMCIELRSCNWSSGAFRRRDGSHVVQVGVLRKEVLMLKFHQIWRLKTTSFLECRPLAPTFFGHALYTFAPCLSEVVQKSIITYIYILIYDV